MRGTGGVMMERRFMLIVTVGVVLLGAPLAAAPQPAARVPRVGVLSPGHPPPRDAFHQCERFEAGLRDLGWTPGSTLVIDYRYAEGQLERSPALAAELVRLPW